jgi:AcrR family transcriptional regulator
MSVGRPGLEERKLATTRERLVAAAFDLFEEHGFAETTVDDVADRAGVGRTTFFRSFRSKEEVIFPDHDAVLAAIGDRLGTATPSTAPVAVTEAARLVLRQYLGEGKRAKIRYDLTRSVPALRAREIASQQRYQQSFRTFLHGWMGAAPDTALRAELMANAIVTAHNHVLRRWLRDEVTNTAVEKDFDDAMAKVLHLFGGQRSTTDDAEEASLIVLRTSRSLSDLMPTLRQLAEAEAFHVVGEP